MRKVLIIAYHFPPDAAIGAVRPAKLVKYLPDFGWEPIVYTLKEKFYEKCDNDRLEPALEGLKMYRGSLVPGALQLYSKLYNVVRGLRNGDSTPNMVTVNAPEENLNGKYKKLLSSLLRLPDVNQGWPLNVAIEGYKIARENKVNAFITSGPPMSTHIGGALLKKATGIKWVADFRDPWVTRTRDIKIQDTQLAQALNRRLESWVVHSADKIVSTTDTTTNYFRTLLGSLSEDKCLTIPNGFDDDDFKAFRDIPPESSSKIRIVYAGSLYANRDPEPFFVALQRLIANRLIVEDQINIELIGDCKNFRGVSVPGLVEQYGLTNIVHIIDTMPYHMCLKRMFNSQALLMFAQGQPTQIPGKVFDYIRINKPIFVIAEDGETKEILKPFSNAFIADPLDIENIASSFLTFIKMIKEEKNTLVTDEKIMRYSRRELTRGFAECLG